MRPLMKRFVRHLLEEHTSPARMGCAAGLGFFLGCLPFYGIHLPICIFFAWILRLNKATVYAAANISNPFFAPVIIGLGIVIGDWVRFGQVRPLDLDGARAFSDQVDLFTSHLPDLFLSCLIGDAILGLALAIVGGPAVYWFCKRRAMRA